MKQVAGLSVDALARIWQGSGASRACQSSEDPAFAGPKAFCQVKVEVAVKRLPPASGNAQGRGS